MMMMRMDPAWTWPALAEDGGDHLPPQQGGVWSGIHHFILPFPRLHLEHPGCRGWGVSVTWTPPKLHNPHLQLKPSHCEYLKPTSARVPAWGWVWG